MPLQPLIDFAQNHFADFRGIPDPGQPSELNDSVHPDNPGLESTNGRPPIPEWIVQPSQDALIFPNERASWRIEGPVRTPTPPRNVGDWGPDVLAFYLPFHFYKTNWGTYLLASGIVYLASVLKGSALIVGDESFLNRAEALLQEHERFHFAAEVACSRAEVIANSPCTQLILHIVLELLTKNRLRMRELYSVG
jgi:hypothetical protein